MLLGSAVCAGVITKVNGFGTDVTIKGPDFRRIYYIKPYNRIGAYIVGTVTGWLLYKTRCEAKLHWLWVICGWLWAGVLGLSVLYGLSDQAAGHPLTNDVAALYNALRGCAWGLAVSWVIFACASGYGVRGGWTFAYLAILVMSFLLSFVASMAFESPFLGLEKMVLAAVGRVSSVLSPPIKRLVAGRKDGGRGEAQYFDRFSNEAGDGLIP
ncbi:uncharacterized protein LOC101856705 [Aplysia californica]|uniref:Uncharacterized protein LOC101856705 n=1 Tax=Aplysia californica TaxID=6500 RepID=A0ABM1W3L7_APLCA|nr:uncharacterized protein LOC101856705 [Aplysia californica]